MTIYVAVLVLNLCRKDVKMLIVNKTVVDVCKMRLPSETLENSRSVKFNNSDFCQDV